MGAPDRIGEPGPGEYYTPSTANAWPQFSADEKLGLVYVPLGNASPDYFGGNRRPYDEKYGDSLVALDVNDGRPRWSFQAIHHDMWDYDLPSQPTLVDLPQPAVVQATKTGQIFVLDRRDGTPIQPVEERPAPQGAAPGDHASPTQPWSAISLTPPPLTEKDMWGITPYDQLWCRIRFRQLRYDGPYTPQSTQGTMDFPGSMGVTEWGGTAIDVPHKVVVVNTSAVPYWMMLLDRTKAMAISTMRDADMDHLPSSSKAVPGEIPHAGHEEFWARMDGSPYMLSQKGFLGPLQAPCNQPPWGHIVAYDLTTGKQLWSHIIGTAQDSGPMGIATHLALPIGTPNLGGPLVTSGGLVFHAGTLDNYLRAYDLKTGRELWRSRLPAGGQATPMTYVAADGRQYVVIAAGGHSGLRTKAGDYLIAYALP
jgi:membrane-bound PQQ-dependent dehydrogenase (glucose/quinate/shikimate family)